MTSLTSQTDRLAYIASGAEAKESTGTNHNFRPLLYFNCYRLIVGSLLLIVTWKFHFTSFGSQHYPLFIYTCLTYIFFSGFTLLLIKFRYCNFNWQLILQIIGDIVFFSVMLYASGGLQSGLGSLLLISLAVSGLISQGRMGLFLAALATISLFRSYCAFPYRAIFPGRCIVHCLLCHCVAGASVGETIVDERATCPRTWY